MVLKQLIRDYLPSGLVLLGGLWLTLATLLVDYGNWTIGSLFLTSQVQTPISMLLLAAGTITQTIRSTKLSNLQKEIGNLSNDKKNLEEASEWQASTITSILRQVLIDLSSQVQCNNPRTTGFYNNERVTIYLHTGTAFFRIARYCENKDFEKSGREYYPDTEGCVARAWRSGKDHVFSLPDPINNIEDWIRECVNNWGIPENTARNLQMKCRSIFAIALKNPTDNRRIGIIVFESLRQNAFVVASLRELLRIEGSRISKYLLCVPERNQRL